MVVRVQINLHGRKVETTERIVELRTNPQGSVIIENLCVSHVYQFPVWRQNFVSKDHIVDG